MQFKITKDVYDSIISYGKNFPSQEVCGALVGYSNQSVYTCDEFKKLSNVSEMDQGVHYTPDPNEFFGVISKTAHFDKANKKELVGIFHTHPHHLPIPSATDINGAGYKGVYLIYSPKYDKLNAYYYDGNEVHKEFIPIESLEII